MNPHSSWDKNNLLSARAFEPLHPIISRLGNEHFPTLQELNALLLEQHLIIKTHSGKQLSFVIQENGKLPFEAQYEPRCYLKGEVATRIDNWHDLLNALVWLTFPKAKAAINKRHYLALTESREVEIRSNQRGAVRDTSTLFDESGVIVACAEAELAGLLRDFQWKELFWRRRHQVQTSMGFYLFGHGLCEKALHPYIGMTGQGLILPVEQVFFTWPLPQRLAHLDAALDTYLSAPDHCLSTRELNPVPLLGVPGWSDDNEDAGYYENTRYFRPARAAVGLTGAS